MSSRASVVLISGAIMMSLPWMWSSEIFRSSASYRIAALWGVAGIAWLLWQIPLRGTARLRIYRIIVIGGVIQTALACWQLVWTESAAFWLSYDFMAAAGRPLGGLRQANLLGSFVATALTCAVYILLLASPTRALLKNLLRHLAIVILSMGLIVSESRSMIAAGCLSVGVLLLVSRTTGYRRLAVIGWIAIGALFGSLVLHNRPPSLETSSYQRNHVVTGSPVGSSPSMSSAREPIDTIARRAWNRNHSNIERLVMLQGAGYMLWEHPLLGSGLGSFERRFPEILSKYNITNPFTVTVMYPHNEVLYVWAEGGIVALLGLSVWLMLCAMPFAKLSQNLYSGLRYGGSAHNLLGRYASARGALLIPLLVHIMSEYPLYLSVVHCAMLLILLWAALPVIYRRAMWKITSPYTFIAISLVSIGVFCFMGTGLHAAAKLRDVERFGFLDQAPMEEIINTYAQPDRILFDSSVISLMKFNDTNNLYWITQFQHSAAAWLTLHNDANLTASMLKIAKVLRMPKDAANWRLRGCESFPLDPRFKCENINRVIN